jgi:tRNA/rRNA methyltransferase
MIQFVLTRPRNPKNIGAAARGMANFGFRELAVVAPYSVAWRETRSAVQAGPVVENAKKYKTLKAALSTSHLVVGFSAGSRRNQDDTWMLLEDLPPLVKKALRLGRRISLVFGSEKSGLTNEELGFCHAIVKIPTVPDCPSMNLAQAVAVAAHAIRLHSGTPIQRMKSKQPLSTDNREQLIRRCLLAFSGAKILNGWDLVRTEQRIRKSFIKWNLNKTDAAMMHRLFRWVVQKAG